MMIIRVDDGAVELPPDIVRNGWVMSFSNWTSTAFLGMSGYSPKERDIRSLTVGTNNANCQASVGKSRFPSLRIGSDLKKKNAAPTMSRPYEEEMVCAMADLPTPAGPCSHKIRSGAFGSAIHVCILCKTFLRVPG